jgi:hypothetical protein
MNSLFIITLGTRDVQILDTIGQSGKWRLESDSGSNGNTTLVKLYSSSHKTDEFLHLIRDPNLGGVYLPLMPRQAVSFIQDYYAELSEWLIFPILQKALAFFSNENFPHEIWWVYTNQNLSASNQKHWNRDTVGYVELATLYLKDFCRSKRFRLPKIYRLPFVDRITDMEYCYAATGQYLFGEMGFDRATLLDIRNPIYMLNQGGIDAINTAIMLKVTEYRPDLKLLQVREDETPCRISSFPSMLFENYQKRNIIEAAKNYRFDWVIESSDDPVIQIVAKSALKLVSYEWNYFNTEFKIDSNILINVEGGQDFIRTLRKWTHPDFLEINQIVAIRWYYRQGLYSEVLWRLLTLSEIMIRRIVDKIASSYKGYRRNLSDANLIKCLWLNNRAFAEDYTFKFKDKIPDSHTKQIPMDHWVFILEYFYKQMPEISDLIKLSLRLDESIREVKYSRNMLIHQGFSSGISQMNEKMSKAQISSIDKLIEVIFKHYDIHGLGLLDTVRDFIIYKTRPEIYS